VGGVGEKALLVLSGFGCSRDSSRVGVGASTCSAPHLRGSGTQRWVAPPSLVGVGTAGLEIGCARDWVQR